MESERIEQLLEKYFEGETTLAEEKELKSYFSQADIPANLAIYKAQFGYYTDAKKEKTGSNFEKNFDKLIASQEALQQSKSENKNVQFYLRWGMSVAAAMLIFISGIYIGKNLNPQSKEQESHIVENIKKDLKEMKEVLSMLKESSASERIKGVNYVQETENHNPNVIAALIETMNKDESTNVRLAAANALFALKDEPTVRDALIESLSKQDDPVMQIALINMMIAMKEKKAVKPIEKFLEKEPIPQKVKQSIQKELKAI